MSDKSNYITQTKEYFFFFVIVWSLGIIVRLLLCEVTCLSRENSLMQKWRVKLRIIDISMGHSSDPDLSSVVVVWRGIYIILQPPCMTCPRTTFQVRHRSKSNYSSVFSSRLVLTISPLYPRITLYFLRPLNFLSLHFSHKKAFWAVRKLLVSSNSSTDQVTQIRNFHQNYVYFAYF